MKRSAFCRPDRPTDVKVNCIDFVAQSTAVVTWHPGSDNYAPIIEYMVEFSTQYERDTWYPAELFNVSGLVRSTDVKVGSYLTFN
ncbi:unnamed protein product [Protopolystoma xenopodis]|uniref:Fibronectin type-III domain-containing protein n=1 Tax=Protopolystoma xenopodis TaxID=117903 RepID=A0A448X767_9PLAT|nr:unnamed protein product [Protopolystoma xenopodis]